MIQLKRSTSVYSLLGLVWLIFAGWQCSEHLRFERSTREAAQDRAREIGSTLGVVIHSQSRFGLIRQSHLERALKEMIDTNELQAVMILNAAYEPVAKAGTPINLKMDDLLKQGVHWQNNLLTFYNLVNLGWSAQNDASTSTPAAIVVQEDSQPDPFRRRDPRPGRGLDRDRGPGSGPGFSPGPGGPGRDRDHGPGRDRMRNRENDPTSSPLTETTSTSSAIAGIASPLDNNTTSSSPRWREQAMTSGSMRSFRPMRPDPNSTVGQAIERMRRDIELQSTGRRPPSFIRPFWMDERHYNELLAKQGLHGFVLQMPISEYTARENNDLWIRMTTLSIGLLAVLGLGIAWRNNERMNRLQLRLLRASEMNTHLQELNVAAAGLAHETRNPLNIVRGLAQLISISQQIPGEFRQKAHAITEEVDRVTGRLNEFINYSRTPAPRPRATNLLAVVADVDRALESDKAEKGIALTTQGAPLMVEADEALLRQVIFNLLLNAFQSVGQGGHVEITLTPNADGEASFEVRDDGPGVPFELRKDIFKPYFTTRPEGTGLGLAVVRQIVLAHHWEVEYVENGQTGAGFRISGLKQVSAPADSK